MTPVAFFSPPPIYIFIPFVFVTRLLSQQKSFVWLVKRFILARVFLGYRPFGAPTPLPNISNSQNASVLDEFWSPPLDQKVNSFRFFYLFRLSLYGSLIVAGFQGDVFSLGVRLVFSPSSG